MTSSLANESTLATDDLVEELVPNNRPEAPTDFSEKNPRVDLIFNVVSGHHDPEKDLEKIGDSLKSTFENIRVWRTTPELDGYALAQEAMDDGANVLVACGGDGTVAAVAIAIKERKSKKVENGTYDENKPLILGVIPRGTANALASAMEIPSDVCEAAKMVSEGSLRRIDMPTIPLEDGNYGSTEEEKRPRSMLLLAGIGLEAKTVKQANRGLKSVIGVFAYIYAGLKTLIQHKRFSTDVTLHDVQGSLTFAGSSASSKMLQLSGMELQGVTVANAAPPTSVLAQGIGEVRPDDGKLEIVCIQGKSPFAMLVTIISLLFSGLYRRRAERYNILGMRARKVTIECTPPQSIVVDGELAGKTPITIELDGRGDKIELIAPDASVVKRHRKQIVIWLERLWRFTQLVALVALTILIVNFIRRQSLFR